MNPTATDALAGLARDWEELPEAARWLRLAGLAHPSLGPRTHPDAWVCDGPCLPCWWETCRQALERAAAGDADAVEVAWEAQDVLLGGKRRGGAAAA